MKKTEKIPTQSKPLGFYRLATGLAWDGYDRDSTFYLLSRWKRSLIRWIIVLGLVATLFGLKEHRSETIVLLLSICFVMIVVSGYRVYVFVQNYTLYRRYIKPLHVSIHRQLDYSRDIAPRKYIEIPRDWWTRDGASLTITFKTGTQFTTDFKRLLTDSVMQKLGVIDIDASWMLVGANPCVIYTLPPMPPEEVNYDDIAKDIKDADDATVVLGIGRRRKLHCINLDDESPHIGLSAGTGAGKSVFAKLLAAQILSKGGRVVILDRKGSHRWARKIAGVTYCLTMDQMHTALIECGETADRRNTVSFNSDNDNYNVGDRILIVAEELNATLGALNSHWLSIRDPKTEPKESPAITAFKNIHFMGRSAKVNMVDIAQSLSAKTCGGPEVRENIGTILLARASHNAWKMTVPAIKPIPRKSKIRGRMHMVLADVAYPVQIAKLTDLEAQELASLSSSIPIDVIAGSQGLSVVPDQGKYPKTDPIPEKIIKEATLITLREAVTEKVVSIELAALRKWTPHPEFPRKLGSKIVRGGRADLYNRDELRKWDDARQTNAA